MDTITVKTEQEDDKPDQFQYCQCKELERERDILRKVPNFNHIATIHFQSDMFDLARSHVMSAVEMRPAESAICVKERSASKRTAKRFKCDICDREFERVGDLGRHSRVHSSSRPYRDGENEAPEGETFSDKSFKCDICNKEFNMAGHLTRHMRVHSGDRPFKCGECPKAFKDSSGLRRHRRIHSNERPYKCDICKTRFIQSKDLKNHLRVHSGERPHQCGTCGKRYSSSSYLTVHVRTHSDVRPYTCQICQKSFHASNTLARHQRSHNGEKPYKCKICKKAFSRLATLTKHQQKIHYVTCNSPGKHVMNKAKMDSESDEESESDLYQMQTLME